MGQKHKNTKLVSVVIPVYNAERYLKECLESVMNQTYKNLQIVVVDDASTDRSKEIIKEFGHKDKRVIILSNETNLGISKTRNVGLSIAIGDYYAPMDSDDVIEPNKMEMLVKFLDENPDYIVVGSSVKIIDANSQLIGWREYPLTHEKIMRTIPFRSPFAHTATLIRLENLPKSSLYDEKFNECEDYLLWHKLMRLGLLRNLNEYLTSYRIATTQSTYKKARNIIINLAKIQKENVNEKYFSKMTVIKSKINLLYLLALLAIPKKLVFLVFYMRYIKFKQGALIPFLLNFLRPVKTDKILKK